MNVRGEFGEIFQLFSESSSGVYGDLGAFPKVSIFINVPWVPSTIKIVWAIRLVLKRHWRYAGI
jgi:hypothetical protein